jgi:hypothetical protein
MGDANGCFLFVFSTSLRRVNCPVIFGAPSGSLSCIQNLSGSPGCPRVEGAPGCPLVVDAPDVSFFGALLFLAVGVALEEEDRKVGSSCTSSKRG